MWSPNFDDNLGLRGCGHQIFYDILGLKGCGHKLSDDILMFKGVVTKYFMIFKG